MLAGLSRALAAFLVAGYPGVAEAYCRTRRGDAQVSSCPAHCGEQGAPLFWGTTDIHYAFDDNGFPQLADEELRAIIQTSFGTWESASCGGYPTDLRFTAEVTPVSLAARHEQQKAGVARTKQDNVIAYLSADEWQELDLGIAAYALTVVRFGASGEIFGADILFNGGKGPLGECLESGCAGTPWNNDLENITTHEVGHFVGLSHSEDPSATMYCSAAPGATDKRQLESDDVAGVCAIYPPTVPTTKYRVEVSPACTPLAPSRTRTLVPACFLLGGLVLLRLRSRTRR